MDGAEPDVRSSGAVRVEVVVPEEQEQGVVEVPEIEGHVAPVQVQAVVSELIHVLPR